MFYTTIHDLVRKAAAADGVSIEALLKAHGIAKATYYWRLKHGGSWRSNEIKALAFITGKRTIEILDLL